MAAYFHGNPPEISAGSDGGLQTLILMNPTTYVQYTQQDDDSNNNTNNNNSSFVFLDPHAPPQNTSQQFVGVPLSGHKAASITSADNISVLQGYPQRVQYSHYSSHQVDPSHHQAACETPRAQQGLFLTLSSQQQQHQQRQNQHQTLHHVGFGSGPGEDIRVGSGSVGSGVTNGIVNLVSSKYLKAAQELLDEVVKADSNDINTKSQLFSSKKGTSGTDDRVVRESSTGAGEGSGGGGEASEKLTVEIGTAERQEIQMKKAKLSSMLHEVEQRYRQYHQQMQMVILSFEHAAGIGSAKSYTSLALKTISRQFRSLKEAIAGQIKTANKSLGEEDSVSGVGRLKFVDHHLRQQRAIQQHGMIQHHPSNNAWRPQRGLPERAVSVLRAWLFENFLHPYPKDSDKHMLAKQTGLTRSQVSNWFINARVRLWKPMVEEMYMEEMKEQGKNIGSMEKEPNFDKNNEDSASKSTSNQEKSPMRGGGADSYHLKPNHSGDLEGVSGMQGSPKRLRTNEETMMQPSNVDFTSNEKLTMKILEERQGIRSDGGYPFMGSFGQYQMDEMSRFDVAVSDQELLAQRYSGNNNGVSLTLGLPHCDSLSSTHHQGFMQTHHGIPMERRVKIGETEEYGAATISAATVHSSAAAYSGMNMQNQKRYVAQLLPDFVA
ncbi:BEL1-like homeodomain protein 1 [Raphanus sativus]|uniref:BEL1-like homeodomain protein 1 n=1 Tax=Raphanus sativus TaxID=3726 RepID=A0A6J0JWM5_RAPSA|nr:BEL1-like homeodomain protein 1 [Raphanus sativus]XP_018440078.2 BEL1-like homeodomain protein 1 [Raphanus sativus]XP_056845117.1 BEL1-like homeodomain protein 1 [Raphanus sativus]XP_056845118.1 BEL1-like homeodomain protein 1 [Raphanus sativus]KAJ4891725.1 BEL1-like homeodomain protein 1 [Raphanus sativus]